MMILSIIATLALVLGAFVAWNFHLDLLAAFLFVSAIVPSCAFEEYRKKYEEKKDFEDKWKK